MKRVTLLLAALLIGIAPATAQKFNKKGKKLGITKRYRYTQPIMFVERGVEFLVFPNGEFDFDILQNSRFNDPYFYGQNNTRRKSINASVKRNSKHVAYSRGHGRIIQHDRYGRVKRIGNTVIKYDHFGRIIRAGHVHMYYRRGILKQVGGLVLQYNRWGALVNTSGQINRNNLGCAICGTAGCNIGHFNDRFTNRCEYDWYDDDWDDDYYFYKRGDKTHKRKKFRSR